LVLIGNNAITKIKLSIMSSFFIRQYQNKSKD